MITSSLAVDFLILLIPGLMAAHAWYQHRQGRWMMIDPLNAFWCGALAVYVAQPAMHYRTYLEWYTEAGVVKTLMMIALAMSFIILGYESTLGGRAGRKLWRLPRLHPSRLAIAGVGTVILGLIGYMVLFASAGGVSEWLAVARGGTNYNEVSGYVNLLENFLPLGVMMLLLHVEFHKVDPVKRYVVWGMGALMWLWLVYLGTRGRTVIYTGTMIAVYYLPRRRNPPLWLIVPMAGFMFLLISFLAIYRGQFSNLSFNLDRLSWNEVITRIVPTLGPDSSSKGPARGEEFSCVAAAVELMPDRVPYNYGYIMAEVFTRPFPRAWFPNKHYPIAEAGDQLMREGDLSKHYVETGNGSFLTGPSLTFVGYYYTVGGPVALIVFGYLTGAFLRMIRTIYDRDPVNEGNLIVYLYLITIGFFEAAAMPNGWMFTYPLILIPLVIFLYLCRDTSGEFSGSEMGIMPLGH